MSNDRSWMYPHFKGGYIRDEFVEGVDEFINFSLSKPDYMDSDKIKCPCRKCGNRCFLTPEDVRFHLYSAGFISNYRRWTAQGEPHTISQPNSGESSIGMGPSTTDDYTRPYRDMVLDAMPCGSRLEYESNAIGDNDSLKFDDEPPNAHAQEFFDLLEDADVPLWDGCKKQTKLSFVSKMLNIKSEFNLSEACSFFFCRDCLRVLCLAF